MENEQKSSTHHDLEDLEPKLDLLDLNRKAYQPSGTYNYRVVDNEHFVLEMDELTIEQQMKQYYLERVTFKENKIPARD